MKKNSHATGGLLFTTLSAAHICGLLEFVPNHRDPYNGIGEWSLFLVLVLMPALYLLHGILSGALLARGAARTAYFAPTIPLTFLLLLVCDLLIPGGFTADMLISVVLRSLLYGLCSLVGVALVLGIRAVSRTIKKYAGLTTKKYSVFREEKNDVS